MTLNSDDTAQIANLAKQFYETLPEDIRISLLSSPAKSFGKGAGNLVDLFFYPINYVNILANGKLEEIQNKTNEKIERKKEEGVYSQNKIGLAAKAIEESKYQLDSEILQDYFSELIANSLDKNYEDKISPYFATLLSSFSESDAIFLRKAKTFYNPVAPSMGSLSTAKIRIPISRFKMENSYSGLDLTEKKVIWAPGEIENAGATISALISFGILTEDWETRLTSEKYDSFYESYQSTTDFDEANEFVKAYNNMENQNYTLIQQKGFLDFTELGILFMETVVV